MLSSLLDFAKKRPLLCLKTILPFAETRCLWSSVVMFVSSYPWSTYQLLAKDAPPLHSQCPSTDAQYSAVHSVLFRY